MESILYPLIAALAVMAASFSGALFAFGRLGSFVRTHMTYLATFSGGVFLLIAYSLAEEAVHEGGWLVGVSAVALGALLMEAFQYFLPTEHHHHGHTHDHTHTPIDGRRVLMGDALHNIGDGILLVGAFATDIYIGIAATFGVIIHEAVQEISEFFILKEAGYTTREALLRNLAVSSTILIGLLFAAALSSIQPIIAIISGIAAGGFISVILHDLLPHAVASVRYHGGLSKHVIAAAAGVGFMLGIQTLVPHTEIAESSEATSTPQTTAAQTETTPAESTQTTSALGMPVPTNTTPTTVPPSAPSTNPAPTLTTPALSVPTGANTPISEPTPPVRPAEPETGTPSTGTPPTDTGTTEAPSGSSASDGTI